MFVHGCEGGGEEGLQQNQMLQLPVWETLLFPSH